MNLPKNSPVRIELKNRDISLLTGISTATRVESGGGNAGNITINTGSLKLVDGGGIRANTLSKGDGGNITIEASNVELSGINPISKRLNSNIRTSTSGIGKGGNITINSNSLNLTDNSRLDASTIRDGRGGNITVNSEFLNLIDNSLIIANTFDGNGRGGDITINSSSAILNENSFIAANTYNDGNGGEIKINTANLIINENSQIAAAAFNDKATGNAGNLRINSDFIDLKNGGVSATTVSGEGGNIFLESDRLILENSQITAFAEGLGDGGNITIDADGLIGINSDITATAIRGDGGNIAINAAGLLGLDNDSLDIDASSQFGQDGTIEIINPQINNRDPVIEFTALEISTNNNILENRCGDGLSEKTLVYTGRTGFDERTQNQSNEETYFPAPGFVPPETESKPWQEGDPIVHSNAVRTDENGDVYFVAELPQKTTHNSFCITD